MPSLRHLAAHPMNAVEVAWDAYLAAIDDALAVHQRGSAPSIVEESVQHAREMLDVVEDEIALHPIAIPGAAGAVLTKLRGRLQSLEQDVSLPIRP